MDEEIAYIVFFTLGPEALLTKGCERSSRDGIKRDRFEASIDDDVGAIYICGTRRGEEGCDGKSTEKLVGAAGFEPATCSTQNCRATRLRYTPPRRAAEYMFRGCRQAPEPQ